MTEQKYEKGQIVRYTGPDLVTYETGKTYTVLGYNAAFDMYGILSELDEAYLLPDDVLQPLSEEETEEIRISERMYEYYRQMDEDMVFGPGWDRIDEKRFRQISDLGKEDVAASHLKKEKEYFASDPEYSLYILSVTEAAFHLKLGIDALSQPFSEYSLQISEFHAENIISTDGRETYDWSKDIRIFDTSYSPDDKELNNWLDTCGKCYESRCIYPSSACWLFDREALLKLADAFPEMFQSLDRNSLDKDRYVVTECHWD